jgi:DnaJ-domain-containing protein 1
MTLTESFPLLLFAQQQAHLRPWPDTLDVTILVSLGLIVLASLVFGLGYWVADFRAWVRACGRKLVLVRDYLPQIPLWARHKTPRSLRVFGLKLPCDEQDLLQAYRQAVKGNHPDHGGELEVFMQLQTSFEEARKFLRSLQEPMDTPANG